MQSIKPRRAQPSTPAPSHDMKFEWRPCPEHPWLGVSVLIARSLDPTCLLEDGSAHPVELEGAA